MSRKKTTRFAAIKKFPNVLESSEPNLKIKIQQFINDHHSCLELACGRGEYTLALASENPTKRFLAIDIKGERIWYGAKKALEEKLENVLFIRHNINKLLDFIAQNSINTLWITFPDPYPKKKHAVRRLTSNNFLKMYQKILKVDNEINFLTDDEALFTFTLENIKQINGKIFTSLTDIYSQLPTNHFLLTTQSYFEKKHLLNKKTIKYLRFSI